LPEWARPYAQKTLARGEALTDINQNPYKTYQNERIAGFSPLQQQAQQQAAGMAPAAQLGTATGMATQAGLQGLGAAYQPGYFGNQFRAPGQYTPGQFSMLQAEAPSLQDYQMGPAQQVGTQSYTGENVGQYMSPYMQNVVDIQKREAQRASDIAGTQQAGQAVRSGAFGGSRAGLLEAERQRNLATQMGDIQATGQQAAFQNAQQQFNQQQQANLQAALANQQAGLATGQQNLAARLGIQQLGAGQDLQAQLANQQALQQAQQAAEQSRQYGYGQQMTAAQQRAQYGLSGQQLGEQSRQYGAGLGMQGANIGLQAANALGGLGQNQYQQTMGINQLQNQYGAQQQALQQQGLTQAYQDFLNQQNYPYKQLGFMSDLVRGLPLGQQSTAQVYQPTTALQTMTGLGLGAYGMKQLGMFGGAKEGGLMQSYADGGMTVTDKFNDPEAMLAEMGKLTEAQLQAIIKAPTTPAEAEAAKRELAMRASERQGLAGAFNKLPYPTRAQFAGGGIIAFAGDETTNDPQTGQAVSIESPGSPGYYATSLQEAMDYNKRLGEFKESTLSDEDIDKAIQRRYALEQRLAGASPYASFTKHLEESEANRAEAMKQAKGFAALQAMGAIMQPGGFVRGLGAAGGAFGSAMEKASQADRAEQRSLASMKFNLADAERKERMGMTRSAVSAASEAIKDKRDAERSRLKVLETQAGVAAKIAQAAKPVGRGSGGAGGSEKEFQFAMKQYLPDIQRQFPGLSSEEHSAMAFERYQKNKSAGLEGVTTRTESTERQQAATNARKRAYSDPAWQTATRNKDKAALATREAELFTEELGKLQPGATGGGGRGGAGGGGSGNNDPLGLRR
jgi:hypothetical protein